MVLLIVASLAGSWSGMALIFRTRLGSGAEVWAVEPPAPTVDGSSLPPHAEAARASSRNRGAAARRRRRDVNKEILRLGALRDGRHRRREEPLEEEQAAAVGGAR